MTQILYLFSERIGCCLGVEGVPQREIIGVKCSMGWRWVQGDDRLHGSDIYGAVRLLKSVYRLSIVNASPTASSLDFVR